MTTGQLRILSIGGGNRARAYTTALKDLDWIRVTGVAEPNKYRRQKLKNACLERYPDTPVAEYDDWKDTLEDVDKYDGVMVCVLDGMHREVAVEFANRGKHLLCEKPLATTMEDCQAIYDAVVNNNVLLAIGHVLRYSPHNIELKRLLDSGIIGDIINFNHTEPVGWFHYAHSYVRGNWRKESEVTFSLMAKCCHDIDLLLWILGADKIQSVSSFGSLSLFKKANKPKEAGDATHCMNCAYEKDCAYSAKKIYYDDYVAGKKSWKFRTVTDIEDEPHLRKALEEGPYGRCVYECDNDVCDNQVVSMNFGSTTATMTMIATSEELCNRKMSIYGSKGEINTDSKTIRIFDFNTRKATTIVPPQETTSGHGGGDKGLASAFAYALWDVVKQDKSVQDATATHIKCTPDDVLASHKVVFLAEKARLENSVERV